MAHYLRYGAFPVGHDTLIECNSISDFTRQFTSGLLLGSCETGAMLGWRLVRELLPEARIVVVRRDLGEVAVSLARKGLLVEREELEAREAMLELAAQQPGALQLSYEDLGMAEGAARLFEFCLEIPFDYGWWEYCNAVNIQVDMAARQARLMERQEALAGLKLEAAGMLERAPLWNLN